MYAHDVLASTRFVTFPDLNLLSIHIWMQGIDASEYWAVVLVYQTCAFPLEPQWAPETRVLAAKYSKYQSNFKYWLINTPPLTNKLISVLYCSYGPHFALAL